MSDFSVGIAQSRVQEVNARVSSRMQEIAEQTGVPFSHLFAQQLNRTEEEKQPEIVQTAPAEAASTANTAAASPVRTVQTDPADLQAAAAIAGEIPDTRPSDSFAALIESKAEEYGLSPALVKAVVQVESDFDPHLVSPAGAMGLMQLMPATAAGLGVTDACDPAQNIDGGIRYLLGQIIRFGGDVKMALAAYNCGPNRLVSREITDLGDAQQVAKLPRETQQYLEKIAALLSASGEDDLLKENFFA